MFMIDFLSDVGALGAPSALPSGDRLKFGLRALSA
jgi:hypothetical protein